MVVLCFIINQSRIDKKIFSPIQELVIVVINIVIIRAVFKRCSNECRKWFYYSLRLAE